MLVDFFDEALEALIRNEVLGRIPQLVEQSLDDLRREHPDKWLEVANALRKLGPYDRVEQTKEAAEAIGAGLDALTEKVKAWLPNITTAFLVASERHFIKHGQELDEALRRRSVRDVSTKEAVEELLKSMGVRSTDQNR